MGVGDGWMGVWGGGMHTHAYDNIGNSHGLSQWGWPFA